MKASPSSSRPCRKSSLASQAPSSFSWAADDTSTKPIRGLLVIGGCCHDYAKQKDILTKGISAHANVQWAIAYDPDKGTKHKNPVYDSPDWAKGFDVVVHDECCADVKDPDVIALLSPYGGSAGSAVGSSASTWVAV